jgi:hypothetical protein
VVGAYYPALLGACSLGERILNHLMLDVRDSYRHTAEHRTAARKDSFADWTQAIGTLEAWGVLLTSATEEFRALLPLRHRSVHFDASIYAMLREDSLAVVLHVREIIDQQFTAFGARASFIEGTSNLIFIKRECEEAPFVRASYLPTCPFVGPHVAFLFQDRFKFYNRKDYGDGDWSDEEFAIAYETRWPEDEVETLDNGDRDADIP